MDPVNVSADFDVRGLPVPEIIGGTPKNWGVPGYAHSPFLEIFYWVFARMDPENVSA